jgi:hypothetical protein
LDIIINIGYLIEFQVHVVFSLEHKNNSRNEQSRLIDLFGRSIYGFNELLQKPRLTHQCVYIPIDKPITNNVKIADEKKEDNTMI